ncbi:MAG: hypothetical protein ACLFR0_02210 [Alphaproteobacteria bacterium]
METLAALSPKKRDQARWDISMAKMVEEARSFANEQESIEKSERLLIEAKTPQALLENKSIVLQIEGPKDKEPAMKDEISPPAHSLYEPN